MESKIQVEEYIRTYDGIIGKILEEYDIGKYGVCIDTTFFDDYADVTNFVEYKDIKSHSFNLIDLIEEGDYVNGVYIEEIGIRGYNDKYLRTLELDGEYKYINIFPSEIHSIVTKEQFKSVEYEV